MVGRGIALLFHDRGTRRGEWSAARPGRTLPPVKTWYPWYRRLGGPRGRSGRVENFVPTGIRPQTAQPVVSHYTNWATRPTLIILYVIKFIIPLLWSWIIYSKVCFIKLSASHINHLTPNDPYMGRTPNDPYMGRMPNVPYMGRTAPLTSKRCILYIYSTNISTQYFKHALYSPFFFSLQNAVCFIMLICLVPVLFTFYIQDVLKVKK